MGAHHFLEHEFDLPDGSDPSKHHTLELFENGGQRYLTLWVGGFANGQQITCKLTKAQAEALADGAESLKNRISD